MRTHFTFIPSFRFSECRLVFQNAVPEQPATSGTEKNEEDERVREHARLELQRLREKVGEYAQRASDADATNNPSLDELAAVTKHKEEIERYNREFLSAEDQRQFEEADRTLNQVRQQVPGAIPEVQLPSQKEQKSGMLQNVKDFFTSPQGAMIGGLISAFIGIMKSVYSMFPSGNPEAQKQKLQMLETLHEKFFGVSELRSVVGEYAKSKNMPLTLIPDDAKDGLARANLKTAHLKHLGDMLKGKTPEEQTAERSAYTFETFLQEHLDTKFLPLVTRDPQKINVTTLLGIQRGERPRAIAKPVQSVKAQSGTNKPNT